MIKSKIISRSFKLAVYCLLITSCSKDPFPSTINVDLGENVVFDATEEQIISVDADSFNIAFEIVSIENTLCPEGCMCFSMGYAIVGFKLINNIHEIITLSFPNNELISDSVQFSVNTHEYYIKLLNARKIFYNKRKTKTKSVIDLKIDSI